MDMVTHPPQIKVPASRSVLGFSLVMVALLSGCATPLSMEEKAHIHTVSISSGLGNEIIYMQSGMTIFEIKCQPIDGEEILSAIVSKTSEILRAKGYVVVAEGQPCDYVLLIEPMAIMYGQGSAWNIEVRGAHFLSSKLFGFALPISANSSFYFSLKRPNSDQIRIGVRVGNRQSTGIRNGVPWRELPERGKRRLIEILKTQLLALPEQAIKKLGL